MILSPAVVEGLDFLAVENHEEYAARAVTSAVKSRLFTMLHGTRVKTSEEGSHSITKQYKGGMKKTLWYKGGMKETAAKQYKELVAMQSQLGIVIPKDLTEAKFVHNRCEAISSLLARIDALETDSDDSENEE